MTALVITLLSSVLATMLLVVELLFPLTDRHTQMAVVTLTSLFLVVCLNAAALAAADLSHEMQRLRDIETTYLEYRSRREGDRL